MLVHHACTVIHFMLQDGGFCAPCPSQTSPAVQRRMHVQSRKMTAPLHVGS